MNRTTFNLKYYIIIQSVIMCLIAFAYISIVPLIKNSCYYSTPCASATNCKCDDKKCLCDFIDENGLKSEIECPYNK